MYNASINYFLLPWLQILSKMINDDIKYIFDSASFDKMVELSDGAFPQGTSAPSRLEVKKKNHTDKHKTGK